MIEGLLEALALKRVPRAGWQRRGIAPVESVADHSWGLALLVLSLAPPELNLGLALSYAALHDLPEVQVGDLTPHDGVPASEKASREASAMTRLASALPNGARLHALHAAYAAQADPEARFVHQLDRLDMALQAVHYARQSGQDLSEFVHSASRAVHDPALRHLVEACGRAVAAARST